MQFRLIPPSGGSQTDRRAPAGSCGIIRVFSRAGGSGPSSPCRFNSDDSTPSGMNMPGRAELSGFLFGTALRCGSRLHRLSRTESPRGKDRSKLTPGRVNLEDSTPTGMIVQDRAELSGFLADKLVATALYSEFEPLTPCRVNPESRGSRADRHDHAGSQRIIRVLRRGAGRGCVLRRSRRAGVEVV